MKTYNMGAYETERFIRALGLSMLAVANNHQVVGKMLWEEAEISFSSH
jgi:hypothetical protein